MVCLNLNEEAEYISEKIGCALDVSTAFVELEDAYYDLIGLNAYDKSSFIDVSPEDAPVVEEEEIIKFVCSNCDYISEKLCERMLEAEYDYFALIGIIDEGDSD